MRLPVSAIILSIAVLTTTAAEIPKESAYVLGSTRGKPFKEGIVFINGKYLPPPYVVERWGVGIRINRQVAVAQAIEWATVLKTQENVRKIETEVQPQQATAAVAQAESSGEEESAEEEDSLEDFESSLDALFDDSSDSASTKKPKSKKKSSRKSTVRKKPVVAVPQTVVTYSLEGEFVHNANSKRLVARINELRREIDQHLRMGGFIFFGDNYARVSGDRRSARQVLSNISGAQRSSENIAEFSAAIRNGGLVYFSDLLCADLFRNKIDYRQLHERLEKMDEEERMRRLLK